MKKNEKLNKIDVISVCLAINAPSSISKKMLKLANINLDVNLIEELASKKLSHLLRSKI